MIELKILGIDSKSGNWTNGKLKRSDSRKRLDCSRVALGFSLKRLRKPRNSAYEEECGGCMDIRTTFEMFEFEILLKGK